MSFTIVSYNVLADAYIRPDWYPGTPASVLDPRWRRPALIRRIAALGATVLCLQEVEPGLFKDVVEHLRPLGYEGHHVGKGGGRPDGCATFIRTNELKVLGFKTLPYMDGIGTQPASGHVALVTLLEQAGRPLAVVNTHLKWDRPGTPVAEQWGHRQARQLLESRSGIAPACPSWVIVGDFNATADNPVVQLFLEQGLVDAFRDRANAFTCNSNRQAKRIDYLFHTPDLVSHPGDLLVIDEHTPLPSPAEPSDHLAITGSFAWVSE